MNIVPQTTQARSASVVTSTRTSTVEIGRQDFLSILLRLIGAEMYKIRRSAISKILLITGLCIIILAFLVLTTETITVLNTSALVYGSLQQCSHIAPEERTPSSGRTCIDHPPTQQELAEAQKIKQEILLINSMPLRLPVSLYTTVSVIMIVGTVLIIILAGTIIGGEYGGGTIRLMSIRGPTRTQFLLSKIGAILTCLIVGFVIMVLTGLVTGALLNLLTGISTSLDFLHRGGWVHVLFYPLMAMFGLFVYAMLALFLATLGRATVAGVTGAIVWWVLESILSRVSGLLMNVNGPVGNFLKAVPDYFISNNISALLQNQTRYFIDDSPSALSNQHALLVLTGYLAVFITLSIWLSIRRDITN